MSSRPLPPVLAAASEAQDAVGHLVRVLQEMARDQEMRGLNPQMAYDLWWRADRARQELTQIICELDGDEEIPF